MVQDCDLQGELSPAGERSHFGLLWLCFHLPQLCCFEQTALYCLQYLNYFVSAEHCVVSRIFLQSDLLHSGDQFICIHFLSDLLLWGWPVEPISGSSGLFYSYDYHLAVFSRKLLVFS